MTAQIFVESPLSQPVASVGAASSVQHHEADMLNGPVMRFGPFVVVPGRRQLLRNGKPVDLGSRAFDLLLILLKSRGSVVTKQDIIKHVWPSTVVDDTNLRFQMASLRKALGKDHDVIKTIPGRGYLFTIDATSAFGVSEEFLPADQEAGRQASLQPVPSASGRYHGSNLDASEPPDTSQVVIIDDDDDIREALEGLLRSAGMLVQAFASVQAFMDHPGPLRAGCIVLDVWMPGRGGLELQAELVRNGIHPPIIFISGHADVHTSVRAMKAGAVEFLTKPVRHQDLLDAIRSAVECPKQQAPSQGLTQLNRY